MFIVPKLRALVSACAIVTASALAPNAFADPITYSEQVIASGSLNGVAFTNASVLLTMYNDTLNVSAINPASSSFINAGTVMVNVAGVGTDTFSNPSFVFDYQVSSPGNPRPVAGFGDTGLANSPTIVDDYSEAFSTYSLKTAFGPVSGEAAFAPDRVFPTAGGNLTIYATSGPATFIATKSGPGGPPISLPNFPGSPDPIHPKPLTTPTPGPVGHLIGSVSATLPTPFVGDYYLFNWQTSDVFNAILSVTGAPSDAVYTARLSCESAFCITDSPFYYTLDSSDGFMADIIFEYFPGAFWAIGISGADADPNLTIQFLTPVEGVAEEVPEPGSIALLGVGLGSFAALRRRMRCLQPRSFSATP